VPTHRGCTWSQNRDSMHHLLGLEHGFVPQFRGPSTARPERALSETRSPNPYPNNASWLYQTVQILL
jgi:hypothetical protein